MIIKAGTPSITAAVLPAPGSFGITYTSPSSGYNQEGYSSFQVQVNWSESSNAETYTLYVSDPGGLYSLGNAYQSGLTATNAYFQVYPSGYPGGSFSVYIYVTAYNDSGEYATGSYPFSFYIYPET